MTDIAENGIIFSVKISGVAAELEMTPDSIKCVTGNTTHFDISRQSLRTFLHIQSNKILLNFYQDDALYQTTLTSKHCLSIIKSLQELTASTTQN